MHLTKPCQSQPDGVAKWRFRTTENLRAHNNLSGHEVQPTHFRVEEMKAPEKFSDLLEVMQLVAELGLRLRSPMSQNSMLSTRLSIHFFFFFF